MKIYNNRQKGLIKMIIIIIIAVAILSWYGVDIKKFFTSEQAQKNFGYIWDFIKNIWTNYLESPAVKLWGIWIDYIWDPLLNMLKQGDTTAVLKP